MRQFENSREEECEPVKLGEAGAIARWYREEAVYISQRLGGEKRRRGEGTCIGQGNV
jgi:hypothetical protein